MEAVSAAFVGAGTSAAVSATTALADLVRLWAGFHFVKAVLATALVVVLVMLERRLRTSLSSRDVPSEMPGSTQRASWYLLRAVAVSTAYGLVWVWLVGGVTLLVANIQGLAAPLASTASLLPTGRPSPQLSATLGELRAQLTATDLPTGSVAGALLADFTLYHSVFVGIASVTATVLGAVAVRALVDRWRAQPLGSPVPGWIWRLAVPGAASCFFMVVALANLSTVLAPEPALLASLTSGS